VVAPLPRFDEECFDWNLGERFAQLSARFEPLDIIFIAKCGDKTYRNIQPELSD